MKSRTRILQSLLAAIAVSLAIPAQAATVAHWRFEGSDFLADSSGNNHTLTNNGSVTQVASTFPNPLPQTGQANLHAASFDGSNYLSAADNNAFTSNQFTLEAFFSPSSIGDATRVIAGHFGSGGDFTDQRSYALVMINTGQLRAFISPNGGTPAQFAGPTLAAGSSYYAAMAVDVTVNSVITIYLQDLSTNDLQIFNLTKNDRVTGPNTYSTLHNSTAPFAIGATGQGTANWEGTIDEVRLSNVKLAESQLLIIPEPSAALLGGLGLLALFRRRR